MLTHDEPYYKQRYDLTNRRALRLVRCGDAASKARGLCPLALLGFTCGLTGGTGGAILGRSRTNRRIAMPEPIIPILEAMKASHQNHLERLERWKAEGGRLENYPNNETIDDFINRERLAVSRFTNSIEHLKRHEDHAV
jgi:hypothetical protein